MSAGAELREWHCASCYEQDVAQVLLDSSVPWFVVSREDKSYPSVSQTAESLCLWLNGGAEPEWIAGLYRVDLYSVRTCEGYLIQAICDTTQDDGEENGLCRLLIDRLGERQRPGDPW